MSFERKLKEAMRQLGITQKQVVGLTGIGKSSISQYLSGKNVPSEERQSDIAMSLGLAPDYFKEDKPIEETAKRKRIYPYPVIPEIRTENVGKLMRMNHETVKKGLKQGKFDWGYAIQTSENCYRYFVNAKRFSEIEGIEVPPEMVV